MSINLPDSEVLFRTWALDQTLISDIVGTGIATRLPSNATLPFAVILLNSATAENVNGAPIWLASVDVDCYAGKYGSDNNKGTPDFAKAFELANAFVRCAFDFPGKKYSITGQDGRVHGFNPIQGPYRIDNTENDLARYTVNVGMYYGEA
jgi:hypothetical protein